MNKYLLALIVGIATVIITWLDALLVLFATGLVYYFGERNWKKLGFLALCVFLSPIMASLFETWYYSLHESTLQVPIIWLSGAIAGLIIGIGCIPMMIKKNFGLLIVAFTAVGAVLNQIMFFTMPYLPMSGVLDQPAVMLWASLWPIGMLMMITWAQDSKKK